MQYLLDTNICIYLIKQKPPKVLARFQTLALKEVAKRSDIPYTTITTYARSPGMATADVTALIKLARVFDVAIEDSIEVVEE